MDNALPPPSGEHMYFRQAATLPMVDLRFAKHTSACYDTHSHDEFSIGVIDSGNARYNNLNKHFTIYTGTTVTINPGDAHRCNPDLSTWSYRMLYLETQWVAQVQQEILPNGSLDYHVFDHPLSQSRRQYQQFDALFEYLQQPDNGLAETQLINYLATHFQTNANKKLIPHVIENNGLARVRERLMDTLNEKHSLEALALEAGLSRYQLIRHFKQRYGQSPHAWQLDQRIQRATRLLRKGQSLSDVAQSLGFADQSHFQRHFKQRLAVTPKRYQSFFAMPCPKGEATTLP